MGLYNYYRNTNPRLNDIKKQLIVYKDVISPHTHTIPALEKVLTLSNSKNPEKKIDGTVLQLFNKANFNTFWVSNQNPIGLYETQTTTLAKTADQSIFVSSADYNGYSYDENVFKPLEKVLQSKNKKKFIIVHLIGTHGAYINRYPKEFNFFKGQPETTFNSKKAYRIINEYDNAVLYNDYIVNGMIKRVDEYNANSFVLYLSDHGDDVYETFDHSFHKEYDGTKPMYDIPFIIWMSNKYKNKYYEDFIFDEGRKYSSENLIYTLSDLAKISFKEFLPEKSIVNKRYKEEPRIILINKEYDKFFNKK
jgi:heptose-I-phosphate ethanolaminephosphotransferase